MRRLVYLGALLGSLVFLYFYREWFSFLLLMALLWLPVLSILVSLPSVFTTRGRILAPDSIPLGEEGSITLTATGTLPVPPFRGRIRVTHAITGRKWMLKKEKALPTEVCGGLKLEAVKCRVRDYLGLFWFPMIKPPIASVFVWPKPIPIAHFPDLIRLSPTHWKSRPGGGFAENHDLRLYRPGDNLRQIHWKLSAKTGKLIFREAMEPVCQRIRLTINLNGTEKLLNRKLGQLLWLGQRLLQRGQTFEIAALTGCGVLTWFVESEVALKTAMEELMFAPASTVGSLQDTALSRDRQFHIGGEDHGD